MNLLVLSINYAPEETGFAPHVASLCESLAEQGHAVTVVTGFPFAPYWSRWPDYSRGVIRKERRQNVSVVRVTHFVPKRPGKLLQRLVMEGTFCFMASLAIALGPKEGWDLVLYVGAQPSIAMLARVVAKIKRLPYVVAINDFAAQAAGEVGILKSQKLLKLLEFLEYEAYMHAGGAIVLCRGFSDLLVGHGYPNERVRIIPSPVDVELIRPVTPGSFRDQIGVSPCDFVVLYSGSMGLKQGLLNVVDAADLLRMEPDIRWVLVGDGEMKSLLVSEIDRRGLTGIVKLAPLQPRDQMATMYAAADLLLLNQVRAVKTTVIPSKLLTYMAAGKAIAAAVDARSQGALLLSESGGGRCVEPESPGALAEVVLEMRNKRAELPLLGRRNRQFAEQHFDGRKIIAAQIEFLLQIAQMRAC